ncbi:hypothetical protein GWI33_006789 [Rhynchophorus ferrugineus]|uniref:Hexosyltransferase n=1 Tax=Rhynchophorus ferrugineus TaxID=354439 RepID=A0A834IFE7_RHYFE|nr:hypothetical protein GWI33_006789 [Rhynchophorus ferrugineus]
MKECRIRSHLLPVTLIISLFLFLIHLLLWRSTAVIRTDIDYVINTELYNYTHPMHLLSSNDYRLLVNFTFTFDQLSLRCNESTFLLVLVHSSPGNFQKRSTIRSTWGAKTGWMNIVFVTGRTENLTVRHQLKKENKLHGDILQGSFLDAYRNLTYKHVMALKYAVYHCAQAKYILKCDDDIFINIKLLKNYLSTDLSPFGIRNGLLCPVQSTASPFRTYRSKWRVSFEEYPGRKYPPYCLGYVIIYSPDVAFALYRAAQSSSTIFWIDDVHITGTMAEKSNISHTDITEWVIPYKDQMSLVNNNVYPIKPFLVSRPDLSETEIKTFWNRVQAISVPKSISSIPRDKTMRPKFI